MSQQEPYLDCKSYTPKAEEIVKRILCLPIHEKLLDEEVYYVIDKIKEYKKDYL